MAAITSSTDGTGGGGPRSAPYSAPTNLSLGSPARGAGGRQIRRDQAVLCPQTKAAAERVGVGTLATTRRQGLELLDIAAADNRIVGLQRRVKALDDVGDMASPLLRAVAFHAGPADVGLVGPS